MPRLTKYQFRKAHEIARDFGTIFIYVSKDDELDTHKLIARLLKTHVVVVPKILPGKRLAACRITSLEELREGPFGILEPRTCTPVPKKTIDLFFIPGTAFDEHGGRKGRGAGYFDRYLATMKGRRPIVGLCSTHMLKKRLETRPWDVPVDALLLEHECKVISQPLGRPRSSRVDATRGCRAKTTR